MEFHTAELANSTKTGGPLKSWASTRRRWFRYPLISVVQIGQLAKLRELFDVVSVCLNPSSS